MQHKETQLEQHFHATDFNSNDTEQQQVGERLTFISGLAQESGLIWAGIG